MASEQDPVADAELGLRVLVGRGVSRGAHLSIEVDGERVVAFEGESVAAALMACGRRAFRTTSVAASPRGVFCGIGICYDCLVVIDGRPSRRACMTPAEEGMRVETQAGPGERS